MIMCVLLCYTVSFHMLQLLLTGRPISSFIMTLDQSDSLTQLWHDRIYFCILLGT